MTIAGRAFLSCERGTVRTVHGQNDLFDRLAVMNFSHALTTRAKTMSSFAILDFLFNMTNPPVYQFMGQVVISVIIAEQDGCEKQSIGIVRKVTGRMCIRTNEKNCPGPRMSLILYP